MVEYVNDEERLLPSFNDVADSSILGPECVFKKDMPCFWLAWSNFHKRKRGVLKMLDRDFLSKVHIFYL
jgi:hypothetical protein